MKTALNIKNFRVFDENGVTFELNPITILTGSNSSGKSSVVKAIFLLNSFLAQIKKAVENGDTIELDKYKLDFTTYPNTLLGRFDKVVHEGASYKCVTLEYTVHSLMLSKDVNVKLVFSGDENDDLNNAYLESITMSTSDGTFYHSCKGEAAYCNLNIIKDDYITFLLTEFAVHAFCGSSEAYDIEGDISKEEYEKTSKEIVEYLRGVDKPRRNDIFRYVRITKRQNSLIRELNAEPYVIKQLQGKKSIFFIPVIEKLSSLSKSEIEAYVLSEFADGAAEDLAFATRRVVDDFMKSDFDSFAEYFADFEERSFDKIICGGTMFGASRSKGFCLLKANDLVLDNNYLTMNPYNMQFLEVDELWDDSTPIVEDEATKKAKEQAEIEAWQNCELTFEMLYEIVMAWNEKISKDGNGIYEYVEASQFNPWGSYYHVAYKLLTKFAEELVREAACPDWCGNVSYVSSARANVSRLYTLENKDDFSMLLQNYFEKRRLYRKYRSGNSFNGKREYEEDSFMNRWIKKFEIGKAISLHIDKEGLGVQIRLHKADDDEGRILADEGYGITQLVSILLQIETAILAAKGEKVNRYWRFEYLDKYDYNSFHYEENTIAIEEPEIHLHPKYQSLLADMFLEAYEKYNINFIIETHSEYLIRKVQLLAAKIEPIDDKTNIPVFYEKGVDSISIFYVDSNNKDKPVNRINICNDGYLDDSFGEGFYDEATRLSRRLISE
jgi:hypothetical protein